MENEHSSPVTCHYMAHSYSDGSDSSCGFSDSKSERSIEFPSSNPAAAAGIHRYLVACSVEDYSDDVVRGLIADLQSPSVDVQRSAAMELRLLAKHSPENRLRIARASAVPPLVVLLSHSDAQLLEHGVTAILNLSLCDENKSLIAAAGAIQPLVHALRVGSPAARENAACALFRLAQVEEYQLAIGRAGAIPPLVALLEGGGHRAKKDAATALYALLAARENKARAVEAGVVRPLLDLMAEPEAEGSMADKAAYVLHRVVMTTEGREAAVKEGGIPVLVEMVEAGNQRQKEIAVLALLEICEANAVYRKMVAGEGAIPPLVALSQSTHRRSFKEKAEALIELLRQPRTAAGTTTD